jgi:hypothetical protein
MSKLDTRDDIEPRHPVMDWLGGNADGFQVSVVRFGSGPWLKWAGRSHSEFLANAEATSQSHSFEAVRQSVTLLSPARLPALLGFEQVVLSLDEAASTGKDLPW